VMLVLFAVIAAIIRYLIREKRSGKGCCGNCQGCAMHGNCSTQNNPNTRR